MAKLADHQTKAHEVISKYEEFGKKRFLIVSPTGSGKTVIFGSFVQKAEREGKKCLILTDRRKLLTQTEDRFYSMFGVQASLISSSNGIKTRKIDGSDYMTFIAMVETLNNRLKHDIWKFFFKKIDYVIIDEAHERRFKKTLKNEVFKNATIIGFTATPIYSSRKDFLANDYEEMIQLASENELIDQGRLVYPHTIANEVDLSNMEQRGGEFTADSQKRLQKEFVSLEKAIQMYRKTCVDYVNLMKKMNNEHWQEYEGKNLKAIFFGVDSSHCVEIANAFNHAGVKADFILSDKKLQSDEQREAVEKSFENNEIEVLVNCQIATKGYDVSDILIVGKLFLTKSLAKDNQTSGRGSRPLVNNLHYLRTADERKEAILKSKKPFFVIIDYLSNWGIHGTWNSFKDWKKYFNGEHLRKSSKNNKEEVESGKTCPRCKNSVSPRSTECEAIVYKIEIGKLEACGHKFIVSKANKIEKDGNYEKVSEEIFYKNEKQLARMSLFDLVRVYKANQADISLITRRLKSSPKKAYIFAHLCGINESEYIKSIFKNKTDEKLIEEAAIKMMLYECERAVKKKIKEPQVIEKMRLMIYKDDRVISNCFDIIEMFV